MAASFSARAVPRSLNSPSPPSRLVITLCTRMRGSRRRSVAFADCHIIDSHNAPSITKGSTGLSLGVPSRRIVTASTTPGSSRHLRPSSARPGWCCSICDQRMPPPALDRQVLSIRSLSGPADKTPGRWLGNGRAAPVANPLGSAGDAVEEPADGGEEAVLLFGEHHVRGVLEDDELGVGQAPRHVFGGAGHTGPVVPAGQHQHRSVTAPNRSSTSIPPYSCAENWRMTSGAYLASPAVRRRYSPSAAPRGSRKWNGIWSSISALTSSWVCTCLSRAHDDVTCSRSSTGSNAAS